MSKHKKPQKPRQNPPDKKSADDKTLTKLLIISTILTMIKSVLEIIEKLK